MHIYFQKRPIKSTLFFKPKLVNTSLTSFKTQAPGHLGALSYILLPIPHDLELSVINHSLFMSLAPDLAVLQET